VKPVVLGGRRRSSHPRPRLRLSNYLDIAALPPPPPAVDWTTKARSALGLVYQNDVLGDCVVAAGMHLLGLATGNATGRAFVATKAQVIADYSAIGGYVPGRPDTDQGCNEEDAFAYWAGHGFADKSKLAGWIAIDPSNELEVKQALYLFESVFFGVGLPDAWINPFPSASGFTWGVHGAADDQNGHAFLGVGYNAAGVQVDTWGLIGTVTWQAVAKYCAAGAGGQLFALLTPDMLATGASMAPNGFAWGDLVADFDAMGGHVPPPPPSPPPAPPPPVPAPRGPTLAQAQAALATLPGWPA
jgi:hypothetical protein